MEARSPRLTSAVTSPKPAGSSSLPTTPQSPTPNLEHEIESFVQSQTSTDMSMAKLGKHLKSKHLQQPNLKQKIKNLGYEVVGMHHFAKPSTNGSSSIPLKSLGSTATLSPSVVMSLASSVSSPTLRASIATPSEKLLPQPSNLAPPKTTQTLTLSSIEKGMNGLSIKAPSLTIEQIFGSSFERLPSDIMSSNFLLSKDETVNHSQFGLLGTIEQEPGQKAPSVFLNTHLPFCLVAVGVQGAGKSHSIGTIIENCMIHCPELSAAKPPVSTIVFHYDSVSANVCEATTLTTRNPKILADVPVVQKMVVLLSPSYYSQRKEIYAHRPNCKVFPLLFRWSDLDADQLKTLMRIETDDNMPLYMSVILDMLRKMHKKAMPPSFDDFTKQIEKKTEMSVGQAGPLKQRLTILKSFLSDCEENKDLMAKSTDLKTLFNEQDTLIVVDMTDSFMSSVEANSIFKVVLGEFLAIGDHSKLAVFDEAHKYLQRSGADELSQMIVRTVRIMRHYAIRIAVSTQSPTTLPPELLELASVALIHRFHSRDWFTYLKSKLPLKDEHYEAIMNLATGHALVFSLHWSASFGAKTNRFHEIRIRQRITEDIGKSKVSQITS